MKSIFVIFILILFLYNQLYSQDKSLDSAVIADEKNIQYNDFIYKENIHTVLLYKEGWELSYPVIDLSGTARLILSFDDLEADVKDYSYSFIHCNADWQPSILSQPDFSDGFSENKIRDDASSFNTTYKYTHYSLSFPNDEVKLKVSGNYIVKVFNNFDPNDLVLTKRFFVTDSKVTIEAGVKQAILSDYRKTGHEVDFTIDKKYYSINDVYSDIKVVIVQNYRWDNALSTLKPKYIKDDKLIYDFDEDNAFLAGAEYRYFDMKSLRLIGEKIDQITYVNPYFHIKLLDDERRTFKTYLYHKDLNGKFLVKTQEGQNYDTDADYAYVYFSLPFDAPVVRGSVYVCGALCNWNYTKNNRMKYNFERKQYELTLLLKQGYYNYQYLFSKDNESIGDASLIEGNHYETENDYLIFVYHKDMSSRYDKLIGFQIANSVIKNK